MAAFLVALVPSAGVLLIFWIGIKALVEADRRERAAQARIEAAQRLEERANASDRVTHSSPAAPDLPPGGAPATGTGPASRLPSQ